MLACDNGNTPYLIWKCDFKLHPPECLPIATALLASSSVVANPLIIFCRFTGGGVGGRDAGGVGGLLRLLCCRNQNQRNVSTSCCRHTYLTSPLCSPSSNLVSKQISPCRPVGSNSQILHRVRRCQRYQTGGSLH